ncbi:hypothetical protein CIB48_g2603 [Xylaria polymorpha]|nr:hypothetical protein CIB48_g2603 [Xylaria polymorpha]
MIGQRSESEKILVRHTESEGSWGSSAGRIASSTSIAYRIKDTAATGHNKMATQNSLLGPILGGLLGFLGATGAAIITFILARRDRVRRMDDEHLEEDHRGHELVHVPHFNGFPPRGTIGAVGDMHHGHHSWIEFQRCIEVNVVRGRSG